tara:strand:+ start:43837 stop:43959 length:123 start_codon:yes stop_codon:yes gene_type:complete
MTILESLIPLIMGSIYATSIYVCVKIRMRIKEGEEKKIKN